MTFEQLAHHVGKTPRTIYRWLKAGQDIQSWLELVNDGQRFKYGKNHQLPDKVVKYFFDTKAAPVAPTSEMAEDYEGLTFVKNEDIKSDIVRDKLLDLRNNHTGGTYQVAPDNPYEAVRVVTIPPNSPEISNETIDYIFEKQPEDVKERLNNAINESFKRMGEDLDNRAIEELLKTGGQPNDKLSRDILPGDNKEGVTGEDNDNQGDPFKNVTFHWDVKLDQKTGDTIERPAPNVKTEIVTTLTERIFNGDSAPLLSLLALVAADAFSCGWIAWESFSGFIPAVVFFSLIGVAGAFASIKNAISYKGREADAWMTSFGVFQFVLHMAAFQMFTWDSYDDVSLAIGKIAICIFIPVSTIGLAITFKPKK